MEVEYFQSTRDAWWVTHCARTRHCDCECCCDRPKQRTKSADDQQKVHHKSDKGIFVCSNLGTYVTSSRNLRVDLSITPAHTYPASGPIVDVSQLTFIMLKFKITSSRVMEGSGKGSEKRYVSYLLQVRRDSGPVRDPNPVHVHRRYTHFLNLYTELRREFPEELAHISFPRKVFLGNFEQELISDRCYGFIAFLNLVASESRLRDSAPAIHFFQDVEREEAQRHTAGGCHDQALTVLENSFTLLNKVYTDVSHVVLCTLCRVVATAAASGGALAGPVERWAALALRRYELVCDADLLLLYGPLLHACIAIWEALGRDKSQLVEELNGLRKRGMKVDAVSLSDAVDALEKS